MSPTTESARAGPSAETRCDGEYRIRGYEAGDGDGLLALDRTVWDRQRGREWFEWKYVENPYVDHVPIFVAERDGEIVGARPFLVLPLRGPDATGIAFQPADTMVHPDHRRRGLFTQMTTAALSYYADADDGPDLYFNFPNDASRPGYEKLGWRDAGRRTTFYRVQNPSSLVGTRLSEVGESVARLTTPVARRYYRNRDRAARTDRQFVVHRHRTLPVDRLAALYERSIPDRLHAHRDAAFYRWRMGSPLWGRLTYVVENDEGPLAALVARTRTTKDGVTITQFAELAPLVGGDEWLTGVARLFDAALEEHADSDIVAVSESGVPREFLAERGFLADDERPLSLLTRSRVTVVSRPATENGPREFGGVPLDERESWYVSFLERDTT
ncbi:GNAT family N-acetyltransferase [Haloprofundus salinisoli]|uniref:GNAT family N-acetyltransferase n=1 Tax=Haloprofundus salinisoli TaxID=2876193 RepID=UPI001CCBBED5|nr:GNAT family N-acetyltransferase [Haloprofundus salinisoli]